MSTIGSPAIPETQPEVAELVIRRLVRALDYAEGFWLGFVKCNLPPQQHKTAAIIKEIVEPLGVSIIDVELTDPIKELLPILQESISGKQDGSAKLPAQAANSERKLALFLYGLDRSIESSDAYPAILSYLNMNRELFRKELPYPIVIWLPDYALTTLARGAPDFWAWRSGLYELSAASDAAEQTFDPIRNEAEYVTSSLSARTKRDRLALLKALLADYRELGGSPREQRSQIDILNDIGLLEYELGEWGEAEHSYEEALALAEKTGDKEAHANLLHNMARVALSEGNFPRASDLATESLLLKRESGAPGLAATLHLLGVLAHRTGHLDEARRLYEDSLAAARKEGRESGMSATLNQLGTVAAQQGDYARAREMYEKALNTSRHLGDKFGIATALHQSGILARHQNDDFQARQFCEESLEIFREIGDKSGVALSLHELGLLAQRSGDLRDARRLYEESLQVERQLGGRPDEAVHLAQLALLDEQEGRYKEGLAHSRQAEEIMMRLGNEADVERIRAQRARLEEKAAAR